MINVFNPSRSFRWYRIFGWQHCAARGMSRLLSPEAYQRSRPVKDYVTLFAKQKIEERHRIEDAQMVRSRSDPIGVLPPMTISHLKPQQPTSFSIPGILTPIPMSLCQGASSGSRRAAIKRNGGVRGSSASRWK